MLKNLGYNGAYHNEHISVNISLENPLDYDFESSTLVFSVTLRAKNGDSNNPRLDDFTFYIMDEVNHLYNAQSIPYLKLNTEMIPEDKRLVRQPDGLIFTGLQHEFLFQDLRIAFYYRPYMKINIIGLKQR